jgi:hypothetical protein
MYDFLGDVNSSIKLNCSGSGRSDYFTEFVYRCNLVPANTLPLCKGANQTFVSYGNRFLSTIDYILIPVKKIDRIDKCEIFDDDCLNVSNHRPVYCNIIVECENIFDLLVLRELISVGKRSIAIIYKNIKIM